MKRRCVIEKYEYITGNIKYDYHIDFQHYAIIGETMVYDYLTLLLRSI